MDSVSVKTEARWQFSVWRLHAKLAGKSTTSEYAQRPRGALWLAIAFVMLIVIKNLWITDDAYITFRTVDNFLHGYGPTWNIDERVQSFTHPLWMLLLSAVTFIIRDIYFAALILSIACTLLAVCIFAFGISSSRLLSVVGLLALATSKSFVDFSTSGLENPLTHLLLALFALTYLRYEYPADTFLTFGITAWEVRGKALAARLWASVPLIKRLSREDRHLFGLALLTALAAFNCMDTILLFLPTLVYAMSRHIRWRMVWLVLLGFVPFLLWELFALWYYGFPFPNTAYAKLGTGVSTLEYIKNGVHYVIESAVHFDPILLVFIPAGLLVPLVFKQWRSLPLALGSLLYLAYVVKIGGDFMAGRFLTASLFISIILLGRIPAKALPRWAPLASGLVGACCLALGFFIPNATIVSVHTQYAIRYYRVIGDERSWWGYMTDISNIGRHTIPNSNYVDAARQVVAQGKTFVVFRQVGIFGYEVGPTVHVEDYFALNDPLLARLPAQPDWLIGHFERTPPVGYYDTVEYGKNVIVDPDLARYYDQLHLITSSNLFDPQRLIAIIRMNAGQFDYLLNAYIQRSQGQRPSSSRGTPTDEIDVPRWVSSLPQRRTALGAL